MFGVIHRLCRLAPVVFALVLAASGAANSQSATPKTEINLSEALDLALRLNPELASAAKEIGAQEGLVLQSGLIPNPELAIEAEDIGAARDGGLQRLTTYRLGQRIELGGKRQARSTAAALAQELAQQDYAARRLALQARVANTFTDALAAQQRVQLADQSLQLAQAVVHSAGKRVLAGKAPPIEATKSSLVLSSATIELTQAQRELAAAYKTLSLLWGNPTPRFSRVHGEIAQMINVPHFDVLLQRVRNNPVAARSLKSVAQRQALLDLEQARRVPDITVSAGYRRYAQTGENTGVLGISIPIPLFDRNQGNLREAHQRLGQAQDERDATEYRLQSELVQTYEALMAAQQEVQVLRDEVLPAAKSAFDVASRGYELGKFGFLEILDAQRTLFQNQALQVRALVNYRKLVNELERLTAMPIDTATAVLSLPAAQQ